MDHLSEGQFRKPVLYLSAPTFTAGEIVFAASVVERLEKHAEIIYRLHPSRGWDQVFKTPATPEEPNAPAFAVLKHMTKELLRCDAAIAILDGQGINETTCFELGVAQAAKKPCYGLQTDARVKSVLLNHPMIDGALTQCFSSLDELDEFCRDLKAGTLNG